MTAYEQNTTIKQIIKKIAKGSVDVRARFRGIHIQLSGHTSYPESARFYGYLLKHILLHNEPTMQYLPAKGKNLRFKEFSKATLAEAQHEAQNQFRKRHVAHAIRRAGDVV
ncbi:hypothetical protein AVEN_165072-1 [Araneus ventricosus]|uniref:Uncharacterized protein n=1 Tax=Araneus ventricosus TaxID=182803 RepID=A0A4Y2FB33_ARAVE|nr:hypothetical protein AVEN_165072-1 [Araneus ventricosus]